MPATMQVQCQALIGALTLSFLFIFTGAHNITRILAKHPEFSTFNHYLTITHLAADINRRQTITVCAVDNSAMSDLLSKGYSVYTLRNILSLHVFADYFGAKKLHQLAGGSVTTSSMFQASGTASGTSGYVNITDFKGGKVAFGALDDTGDYKLTSSFIKTVQEMPYNISVIQVSHIMASPDAEAPTAPPAAINLTSLMSEQECKAFSDLLIATKSLSIYNQNLEGGLTVFCPSDAAIEDFMPKYKNLTAEGKQSLVLFHACPIYQSMQNLKSNNGLINTLATDGKSKYDFDIQNDGQAVTLKTRLVRATVTGTLKDQEPLALYKINKVLQPRELFKGVGEKDDEADSPAESPKAAPKKKKGKAAAKEADADAPSPDTDDSEAADQTASGAFWIGSGWWMTAGMGLGLSVGASVLLSV
ncbi:fasciclin-like arabinogalactan protein 2 [Impatiens glandulifera]|uniref:fasciclin-like arabinogalactan protein 2 n=1 Tax=Impatiens glandulifera TaxID=253017 RepID=UPI001FB0E4DC|nr:fasciclin-like arabinogalactan protein 2 [Impatiens glandulifera]